MRIVTGYLSQERMSQNRHRESSSILATHANGNWPVARIIPLARLVTPIAKKELRELLIVAERSRGSSAVVPDRATPSSESMTLS